jgi:hypothetical protein
LIEQGCCRRVGGHSRSIRRTSWVWAPALRFLKPISAAISPKVTTPSLSKQTIVRKIKGRNIFGTVSTNARTVALVLDLNTGLTSPQFHVKMDPTFQTMRRSFEDQQPIKSMWMEKCGFLHDLEIQRKRKHNKSTPSEGVSTPSEGVKPSSGTPSQGTGNTSDRTGDEGAGPQTELEGQGLPTRARDW